MTEHTMRLAWIDGLVILSYFAFLIWIGVKFFRRSGQSLSEYFVSSRNLPWWLAGTSMVATTFAADTPLAVTELVSKHGISGNWLWWSFAFSGVLTAVVYAPLWHRARVLTDVEFVEVRYGGAPALFLRGFRALYLGVLVNCLIMGWVHLGMAKIFSGLLGVPKFWALAICLLLTAFYSASAGLRGIAIADGIQFILAMAGSVLVAVLGFRAAGGWEGIYEGLSHHFDSVEAALSFWPTGRFSWELPIITFAVYLTVNWWASWYPGAEPGGGGYIAQRIFSTRSEREGVWATLWFNVAHYALRPWPWIIAALAAISLYGRGEDPGAHYVRLMAEVVPSGLLGLLAASFLAAYMSTISTHLNWGASYLVNDFYLRFLSPGASQARVIWVSRGATWIVALISLGVAALMSRITAAWELLLLLGAGTGPVYLLRWYWKRISAWSEIFAMAGAVLMSLICKLLLGLDSSTSLGFAQSLCVTVLGTTFLWLAGTYLMPMEEEAVWGSFVRRVRPWDRPWRSLLIQWVCGWMVIYACLFGAGYFILGRDLGNIRLERSVSFPSRLASSSR